MRTFVLSLRRLFVKGAITEEKVSSLLEEGKIYLKDVLDLNKDFSSFSNQYDNHIIWDDW